MTTNLALPGFGSVMARRTIGYFQVVLCVMGFVFTFTFGLRLLWWYIIDNARIRPEDDPAAAFSQLWIHARWALFGVALFVVSWVWALITSFSLLRQARPEPAGPGEVPPRMTAPPPADPGAIP